MELSPILHLSPNVAGSNDVLADDPWSEPKPSHKRLFGEKGWLGNNADLKELAEGNHKTFGLRRFGKKLKMQVEELVEDLVSGSPCIDDGLSSDMHLRRPPLRQEPTRAVLISLDAPTQARLYSQLEVMICVAANRFLVQQCNRGLLSDESISKISNYWAAKNRPKVVEFHYDQATQRQLILSNLRTIQFHGLSATNSIQLRINLNNWKAIGKEMGIRTFCAPDSAIRKHVFDIRNILEMLGAPLETMRDFEVVQVQVLLLMEPD
ncbi:uncharacterized protein BP01DRAFT_299724 [Aspergillus saccharolyticus JOP 1030-1]|uniref:Uncharacterized protein n=1 Tax=Aspergillus saccharolyticus JOP 1030-1 TaxID=1450539 RepID=A0A318Z9D1_9EURO|nr:hypothetical protein BP01DRAFT_299724 [Aspergillus saccharolyticus JOP 1030-1]PYH43936.1 hypothetical protein BP01DRAFT_299724 [Aspergillus saccharolyticus JOP 1030-1]